MWANFYANGGFGMYPTTAFGLLLLACSVLLLLRPQRRHVPLVVSLAALTASSGLLGFSTGLISTFRYLQNVEPSEQLKLAALGCAEALNNFVLALLILVFAGILCAASAVRALRAGS